MGKQNLPLIFLTLSFWPCASNSITHLVLRAIKCFSFTLLPISMATIVSQNYHIVVENIFVVFSTHYATNISTEIWDLAAKNENKKKKQTKNS